VSDYAEAMPASADPTRAFRRETTHAIAAVRHGLELVPGSGADRITSKGGRDLVTDADTAVEDSIREQLTAALPAPVIGEERGGTVPADGAAYWLVDPICGTRNLASGTPLYSINLALVEHGLVTVGVCGDPSTGDLAVAERGGGAWACAADEWRPLRTDASSHLVNVEDGKSTGRPRAHAAAFMAEFVSVDRWDFRSLGTTLGEVYVAAGRFAGYVVFLAPSLHAAAGTLLVTEAGGQLTDIDGGDWTLESESFIAAADVELHRALLQIARSTRPPA